MVAKAVLRDGFSSGLSKSVHPERKSTSFGFQHEILDYEIGSVKWITRLLDNNKASLNKKDERQV
ncbi:hypothetical protein BI350_00845 [Sporosarcina ureilytica]|uniref:Uncharacterized protein n=1 Tax=Sporosarcina ureilytica TaxID=298596 RepID=A0A1D8JC71_9BACL|nr:hypothetical protein BI350_00845 [Sporosarcina ureilytica]